MELQLKDVPNRLKTSYVDGNENSISERRKKEKEIEKKKHFEWVLIQGANKTTGSVDAVSSTAAKSLLRKRGQEFTYIKEVKVKKQKVKEDHIVLFLRQWSAVTSAGIGITDGIKMIADTTAFSGLRSLLMLIYARLMEGDTVEQSFSGFPKYFDHITLSMLRAAERGGIMDKTLSRMATSREKSRILNKKIKSAMIYPAVTVFVMIIVVIILMVKVIPVFAHLFQSFGSQLPELTQLVVDLSYWMQHHVLYLIFGPIIGIFLFRYFYRRSIQLRWVVDRAFLRFPVFGDLMIKASTTRFCQIFGDMQEAGVPLPEIMETMEHVSGNMVIDAAIARSHDNILQGKTISSGLEKTAFPNIAVQMIKVGEESGNLEEMLRKTGEFFESEVNEMVDRLSTLLEPMIMVFLGVVIGTLVIAMYLPMLDMGQAILSGSH